MTTIRDVHNPWRDALLPAMFDGCPFFVEAGSQSGGRRIVTHQFPKRDMPYSEDMGRRATEFQVRGYVIAYVHDAPAPVSQAPQWDPATGQPIAIPPTDSLAPSQPL